ncbi:MULTISPECIES: AraC family transcriptional regulator [Ruegeria]|uniref:AraC family transcriptional regulator n=1 Tax=Ruegeria TaxID=97050 RepID=UPI00147EADFA|nr:MULTISPECIES: AraC family transcriptional regulator [Ruegeria]
MGQTLLKVINRRHSERVRDPMQNSRGLLPTLDALDQMASPRLVERALKDVGLTRTVLEGPPVPLPIRYHAQLLETISGKIGERHLGAIMAKDFAYSSLNRPDPFSSYALGASRLDIALQRAARALPFLQRGTQIRTRTDGNCLVFSFGVQFEKSIGAQLLEQEIPSILIALVRPYLGTSWVPDWVELPAEHRLQKVAFARLLGTEVRANADFPGIAIPMSQLQTPTRLDEGGRVQMTAAGIERLRLNRPPRTHAETVRQALRMQLNNGSAAVDDVAAALGVGVRTLQRQLRIEDVTFKEIALSEQVSRAKMLLSENDLNLSQIAFYLGFSEVNSFRRAFRTWFGQSPTQYRSRAFS